MRTGNLEPIVDAWLCESMLHNILYVSHQTVLQTEGQIFDATHSRQQQYKIRFRLWQRLWLINVAFGIKFIFHTSGSLSVLAHDSHLGIKRSENRFSYVIIMSKCSCLHRTIHTEFAHSFHFNLLHFVHFVHFVHSIIHFIFILFSLMQNDVIANFICGFFISTINVGGFVAIWLLRYASYFAVQWF